MVNEQHCAHGILWKREHAVKRLQDYPSIQEQGGKLDKQNNNKHRKQMIVQTKMMKQTKMLLCLGTHIK
jgi:hypothetical protein